MKMQWAVALVCFGVAGCGAGEGFDAGENGEPIANESAAIAAGTMHPGEYLFAGNKLLSPNCGYRMIMQSDGNLVIYRGTRALWSTGTAGVGDYAVLQGDGNFVVHQDGGGAFWASHTRHMGTDRLLMQNDGNAVISDILNRAIWTSNTRTSGSFVCGSTPQFTETTVLESHTDRPGSDLPNMPVRGRSLFDCGNRCGGNFSCSSFTWVAANQVEPQSQCWLKSGTPAARFTSLSMTSGVKKRVMQGGIPL